MSKKIIEAMTTPKTAGLADAILDGRPFYVECATRNEAHVAMKMSSQRLKKQGIKLGTRLILGIDGDNVTYIVKVFRVDTE